MIFILFFALSTVGFFHRLLGEHVQKSFTKVDRTDCEIIMFEVERKETIFYLVPSRDSRL
jgi:hypothetical protein